MPVMMPIIQDFNEALKIFKKKFQGMKSSLDPFGILYLFRITVNLPFCLPRLAIDFMSNKFAIIFSNNYMSKVPLKFNGVKQR
jgi:hypothetical protein